MTIPEFSQSAENGRPASGTPHDTPVRAPAARKPSPAARVLLSVAVLAVTAAGLTWWLLPHGSSRPGRATAGRPTVAVGYRVSGSGTARVTYTRQDGTLRTLSVHLPWEQTAALTAGSPAAVSIVLGPDGGHATCALTLHGAPVQHATAYGSFGRATCTTAPTAG